MPSPVYETEQPAPPPPAVEQESQIAAQVSNLAAEVEMLREDQARRDAAMAPAPAPPPEAEEKPPTTLFIYRDGHQLEAQNYAILGQTLWVFSGQTTRRIPLADLNLPATRKLNEERGVDVTSPGPQ
jgi:anti-sigma factor ChrR (cupin superfamily)